MKKKKAKFYTLNPIDRFIHYDQFFFLFYQHQGLDYIYSQRGRPLIVVDNYLYRKNRGKYWRCIRCAKYKCRSRLILSDNDKPQVIEKHTHGPEKEKIDWGRKVKTSAPVPHEWDQLDTNPVQLYTRQPHFDSEILIQDETEESDQSKTFTD